MPSSRGSSLPRNRTLVLLHCRWIFYLLSHLDFVQLLSCVRLFATSMDCSMSGFPVLHYLLDFAQIHVHWVSDAIQPSHPLSSPSLPTLNLSQHQGLFHWVGSSIMWPKYWNFSFNISPFSEYSGLISFRIDWFDFRAVQGTLKRLLQQQSLKYQFFSIQPSLWSNSHSHTWLLEKPWLWL